MLATCQKGGAVMTDVAITGAIGIICRKDSNLLAKSRSHIALTRDWSQGFVERKATTKAKISVEEIDKLKEQFLFDIKAFTVLEDIPESLILNWDLTVIKYVPMPDWTLEKRGIRELN